MLGRLCRNYWLFVSPITPDCQKMVVGAPVLGLAQYHHHRVAAKNRERAREAYSLQL